MTKSTKTLSLHTAVANTLLKLRDERINLDADLFAKANTALYTKLAEIFFAHAEIVNDEETVKAFRDWYDANETLPKFKTNSPTLIDMMTRIVLADSDTKIKRVNAYARALKVLNKVEGGFKDVTSLVAFITENGGLEEIDADLLANKQSKKDATAKTVENLRENFSDIKTSFKQTIKVKEVSEAVTELKDKYVSLVGIVNADGSITVKHVCAEVAFAGREKNFGGGAVTAAIKNMLSVQSDAIATASEKQKAPKKAGIAAVIAKKNAEKAEAVKASSEKRENNTAKQMEAA